MNFNEIKLRIDSLAIFAELKSDPVIASLRALLENFSVANYSIVIANLFPHTDVLSHYIRDLALGNDNFYVRQVAAGADLSDGIKQAVKGELKSLQEIAEISCDDIHKEIIKLYADSDAEIGFIGASDDDSDESGIGTVTLPKWRTEDVNLAEDFAKKLAEISVTGYGVFAKYAFFRLVDGNVIPVTHPDIQPLNSLVKYERERNLIIKNTEALLEGTGASNMLLYGDMGTGKSTTIKAVAGAYVPKGLRLIEVKKEQLFMLPDLIDMLAGNPLKFILFIDDLSFAGNDDNFSALKSVLEGSIAGCSSNTVIYATSNRRHLVRESARDRQGGIGLDDDLHLNDTLQETMSLAARFGLTITFQKPDKDDYLQIVRALACEYGIEVTDEEALFKQAEAFAIRKNGRSPRTARQFIELTKIGAC